MKATMKLRRQVTPSALNKANNIRKLVGKKPNEFATQM